MGGDRSNYASQIQSAEDSAKRRKVRRWANYNEEEANKELAKVDEDKEKKENEEDRKVNYTKVVVTEVTQEAKIYAQHIDEGPKLEALMKQIREEFSSNPPLAGAYQPKKGKNLMILLYLHHRSSSLISPNMAYSSIVCYLESMLFYRRFMCS